jgi:methylated-DNA-[protein]-cysteine S-methyltransferase
MTRYCRFATPLGPMYATLRNEALGGLYFEGARHAPAIASDWMQEDDSSLASECARQVREYLAGTRRAFELPLAPAGTPFQQRVWAEIARIPYGATLSYAELARRSAAPSASRAAGAATGRNPLTLIVPCHRVVGSGGSLTGYAGGMERKARLLALEGAREAVAA